MRIHFTQWHEMFLLKGTWKASCSFWDIPTFPFFPYFTKKQPWNSQRWRFRAIYRCLPPRLPCPRWFVKDGIWPVQRRSGKNGAYRGAFWRWVAGGLEGGKNADVTMWVFGHVRSTCAELMVFAICTILFCISLGARPMQRILYHFQSHGTHVQVPCREVSMQMESSDWEITAVAVDYSLIFVALRCQNADMQEK